MSPNRLPGLLELALWSASEDDLAALARLLHDTSCTQPGCRGYDGCGDVRDGRYRRWVTEIAATATDYCTEYLARNSHPAAATAPLSRPDGGDPDPSASRRPGVHHNLRVGVAA